MRSQQYPRFQYFKTFISLDITCLTSTTLSDVRSGPGEGRYNRLLQASYLVTEVGIHIHDICLIYRNFACYIDCKYYLVIVKCYCEKSLFICDAILVEIVSIQLILFAVYIIHIYKIKRLSYPCSGKGLKRII